MGKTGADPAGGAGAQAGAAPVTLERVAAAITGLHYTVERRDDFLWAYWNGRYFDFRLFGSGEVLQVRGVWNAISRPEDVAGLVRAANEWNAEQLFPKAFVLTDGEHSPTVMAELNVPVAAGAAEQQLTDILSAGLVSGESFFAGLDRQFPDAVRQRLEAQRAPGADDAVAAPAADDAVVAPAADDALAAAAVAPAAVDEQPASDPSG